VTRIAENRGFCLGRRNHSSGYEADLPPARPAGSHGQIVEAFGYVKGA
jgi:hypothetical protein